MPTFQYQVKKGPQEFLEGELEAETRAQAINQLIGLGYTPIQIRETSAQKAPLLPKAPVRAGSVPRRELNQFTRQFASLMRSQVPVLRALNILKDQTQHAGLSAVIEAIGKEIQQGQTLSDALGKFPKLFSPLYISLIRSAEAAGMLEAVLDRLSLQADRDEALNSKIKSALAYPLFVGMVGAATVVFLMTFVMPRLVKLLGGFGGQLPIPTQILLTVSGWFQEVWFWAAGVGGVLGVGLLVRSGGGRVKLFLDRLRLHLPILGKLTQHLELARFARSFGLLLERGIPILRATEIATPVINNRVIRREFERLAGFIKEGGSLASSLKALSFAPPFLVHTVAVGEEGGRVAECLMEVADFYENESERLLEILASLLEPLIILAVGGVVGCIVMAVLLPVFEMSVLAR